MAPSRRPGIKAPHVGLADSDLSPSLKRLPYLVDRKDESVQNTLNRLKEHLAQHSALEETLQMLQASTSEHQRHKNNLQVKIFQLQALIAPASRVPLDIWSHIFGFLVASDPDTITIVSRVCTRWRQASRLPQLWSHIIIGREGFVWGNKVNIFKGRSGSCALKISYSQSNGVAEQWEAWDALMNTAERWTTVALTFDDCMSASHRIPQLPPSPALRELSVSIRGLSPVSGYEGFGFGSLSYKAPHLKSLTIFTHVLPSMPTWFDKITKLHIVDTFPDIGQSSEYLQPIQGHSLTLMLLSFPALVEFIFDGERSVNWLCQNSARGDPRSAMSLSMPNLRRLHLSCYFGSGCILLRELTAENLESLTVRLFPILASRSLQEPSAIVDAFLIRSPQLRSLTLCGLNHTALLHGLCRAEGLRRLVELHLEHFVDLQLIAEDLQRIEANDVRAAHGIWALPQLSAITILASNPFDVPFQEMDTFIRDRNMLNLHDNLLNRIPQGAHIHKYIVNIRDKGAAPGTIYSPIQDPRANIGIR